MIKHYIINKKLIPDLLDYGWIVMKQSWTDCPPLTQERIQENKELGIDEVQIEIP